MTDNNGYSIALFDQHAAMLEASGIPPEHASARGYVSVDQKTRLQKLNVTKAGRNVPGLLVPSLRKDGSVWGYQYRPDNPRMNGAGKPVKYETPWQQRNGIDVPPGVGPRLDAPADPLLVTEGCKKADAAAARGLACIALPGVWSWRGKNEHGGKSAVADWHDIALDDRRVILAFDSDVMIKRSVRRALDELAGYLASKGAAVEYLHLPDLGDGKTGLDDYLANGHSVEQLWALVRPDPPEMIESEPAPLQPVPTSATPTSPQLISLDECHKMFQKWLGEEYDLDVLDAVLCALAVEKLDGDPLWLLVISGPGAAKTETVQACAGAGAFVTSTISSDAALLSGSPKRDRAKDATGGLLRRIGNTGVLVVKDVTSILSANRDSRATVLAAMREVYDGFWERNLGVEGGRSLSWRGRIAVIGAVTTAWDTAHSVVATMGDRFVLVRLNSEQGRQAAYRHTMSNTGDETAMRAELASAVGGVLAGIDRTADLALTEDEVEQLLPAADLVTLARTGVEYDYQGNVIDAHAPEMPTRFARQLQQVVRGGLALGMDRATAMRLAIRCARDSMPLVRLAIADDLAKNPHSTPTDIRRRVDLPWTTVDRQAQALHMLRVLACDEVAYGDKGKSRWYYSLADGIDPEALKTDDEESDDETDDEEAEGTPDLLVNTPTPSREGDSDHHPLGRGVSIAGGVPAQVSGEDATAMCSICGNPLDPVMAANGELTHPTCDQEGGHISEDDVPSVVGYLDRHDDGSDLRVPCPACDRWHVHGAGDGDVQPGSVTHRGAHCPDDPHAYSMIVVALTPFDPAWKTTTGKKSSVWQAKVANDGPVPVTEVRS